MTPTCDGDTVMVLLLAHNPCIPVMVLQLTVHEHVSISTRVWDDNLSKHHRLQKRPHYRERYTSLQSAK